MGILQALCGGQPLLIVGVAEPIVIIYAFMFEYATREGIPFLAWSAWTCVWASAKRDFLPDLSARLQQRGQAVRARERPPRGGAGARSPARGGPGAARDARGRRWRSGCALRPPPPRRGAPARAHGPPSAGEPSANTPPGRPCQ